MSDFTKILGGFVVAASGLLGERLEGQLRRHLVEVCNAFDLPTIAERDPSSDLVIVGDHAPERKVA